ncbi:glutathione S-transferase family protein [Gloeobacter morelensis]|uniref:Glutathione S-transferase N-terminal domain-containing protein n=1 Tax=Gloeobacter morelensis MG652769 TaxID=2781736 RepID=A0ABY3PPZ2_9CYAN|nr:glutathione S-transferase N-terminal domain-containing protein [Gloeobacter morelensis]UFP95773.1 glutathione S-transferase N-terminal domain-containing protein [Gloeobacter morelensis MG652769]
MIDLYTFATPNGHKVSIVLEEVGLPYTVHVVDISSGDQHREEYLAINPNGKIPAIVDHDTGLTIFESGAILIYLAEKTGKLLPSEPAARYTALQWLMWQMGGVGPMFGQLNHFKRFADEHVPYAIDRYFRESIRLYRVLNRQLSRNLYVAGREYTIADVAVFPWVQIHAFQGINLEDFPAVEVWFERLKARPAVQRGMQVPAA